MSHVQNKIRKADSREGFTKGDAVTLVRPVGGDFPTDGKVNGWATYEYGPEAWFCSVTWGGRYIGRYQAAELDHAPAEPEQGTGPTCVTCGGPIEPGVSEADYDAPPWVHSGDYPGFHHVRTAPVGRVHG